MNAVRTLIMELAGEAIMTAVIFIFAVLFAFQEILKLKDWFCDRFGIRTKSSIRKEGEAEMLLVHDNDLAAIKRDIRSTYEKIDVLAQMLLDMQNKNDASERARLKDQISNGYRFYHNRKSWTNMEKEAFMGLIKDYEMHGGRNSFVHTICEPESCTWKIEDV